MRGKGRKKVEIKMIKNEDARQICFSKRRTGLFTKASEISTRCGAKLAIIVHSPAGRPYSYGSPSLDPVIDAYLAGVKVLQPPSDHHRLAVQQLNQQLIDVKNQIAEQQAKKAVADERIRLAAQTRQGGWLEKKDQLGLDELSELLESLKRLKWQLDGRVHELLNSGRPATAPPPPPQPNVPLVVEPYNWAAASSSNAIGIGNDGMGGIGNPNGMGGIGNPNVPFVQPYTWAAAPSSFNAIGNANANIGGAQPGSPNVNPFIQPYNWAAPPSSNASSTLNANANIGAAGGNPALPANQFGPGYF